MLNVVQDLDYSFSPWIARYQMSECPECLPPCNLKKMEVAISSTAVKRFLDISAHKSSDSFPLCTLHSERAPLGYSCREPSRSPTVASWPAGLPSSRLRAPLAEGVQFELLKPTFTPHNSSVARTSGRGTRGCMLPHAPDCLEMVVVTYFWECNSDDVTFQKTRYIR